MASEEAICSLVVSTTKADGVARVKLVKQKSRFNADTSDRTRAPKSRAWRDRRWHFLKEATCAWTIFAAAILTITENA